MHDPILFDRALTEKEIQQILNPKEINSIPNKKEAIMPLLIQLITAITPIVPMILKAKKAKKDEKNIVDVVKESTKQTEIAQGGYLYILYSIYQTMAACETGISLASLSCLSQDQWVRLAGFVSIAFARLREKAKELGK